MNICFGHTDRGAERRADGPRRATGSRTVEAQSGWSGPGGDRDQVDGESDGRPALHFFVCGRRPDENAADSAPALEQRRGRRLCQADVGARPDNKQSGVCVRSARVPSSSVPANPGLREILPRNRFRNTRFVVVVEATDPWLEQVASPSIGGRTERLPNMRDAPSVDSPPGPRAGVLARGTD